MKILRFALRASFPAILYALSPGAPLWGQGATDEPVSQTPIPALPVTDVTAQNPSQTLVDAAVPVPPPEPWYDKLFTQKLPIDFGFRLAEEHSDNIFFQQKKTDDYITDVSATLILTLGHPIPLAPALDQETDDNINDLSNTNYFQLNVTPTLILFSRNSFLDDVDENIDVVYSHQFTRLTLSVEQSYQKLSQPTVQVNAQGSLVNRDIYVTTARANYIYSDQLSTYGTLSQTINSYQSDLYTDNTEWSADYYFLYQLFPKMNLGFGPRLLFDDIQGAANQTAQDGLVHLTYVASDKFNLTGAAGAEYRQFQNDSAPSKITPIVEGVATYKPFDSMTISLDGERHRIVANGQPGTDYTASIATLAFRQRFFQVVYLSVLAAYEDDQYTGAAGLDGTTRDDEISYGQVGLEWESFRGLTVDLSYRYLQDDSNIKAFTFNESRATISATFKY